MQRTDVMSLHLPIHVQVSRKLHPGRGWPGNRHYWRSNLAHQVWCCWNTCVMMDGGKRRKQTVTIWQKTQNISKLFNYCLKGYEEIREILQLVLMQEAFPILFPLETKSQHLCGDCQGLSVNQIYRQMIRHTELSGSLKSNDCCSLHRLQAL